MPELTGYFCCYGIIPGFSQNGGLGKLAAEWMVEGEPTLDMFGWDMARYGAWAGKAFTKARVGDQYAHRFKIHFPNEEREAGRPGADAPCLRDAKAEMGAHFGLNYGWEHPLWFAADGEPMTAQDSRGNLVGAGGARSADAARKCGHHRHLEFRQIPREGRGRGGIGSSALFAKPDARALVGRSCLTPLIGKRGGVAGDFTVTRLGEDEFWIVGSVAWPNVFIYGSSARSHCPKAQRLKA